jgi:hypothetical protein
MITNDPISALYIVRADRPAGPQTEREENFIQLAIALRAVKIIQAGPSDGLRRLAFRLLANCCQRIDRLG